MIDAYGGFVRCGNCNYKFNIHDQVLIEDEPSTLVNTTVRPSRGDNASPRAGETGVGKKERIEPRLERDEEADAFNIRFRPDGSEDKEELVSLEDFYEPRLDTDVATGGAEVEDTAAAVEEEAVGFPDSMEALDIPAEEEFSPELDELTEQMLESEPSFEPVTDAHGRSEPLLFDSLEDFGEEDADSGITLISDSAQDDNESRGFFRRSFALLGRLLAFLFWFAVAAGLVYLLFSQIRDTLYPAYRNHALVQKIRASSCALLPCEGNGYDKDLYEIVVSRMDEVQDNGRQLHVSIFLLNKAETAQAYPDILLTLKTIDGTTVGQRVIQPEEYLTSHDSLIASASADSPAVKPLVQPNKLGKILIKFDRPPAAAVGFEASVVE